LRAHLWLGIVVVTACSSGGTRSPRAEKDKHATTATDSQWAGQQAGRAEDLIAGRFPGVDVTAVPGGVVVRIRGGSTVMGSGEPLFVIDGMVVETAAGGALVGINPADIAKIQVLKDIGSTAQYGVRGANGVILITTKKQ
jgi:TonB-dependent SusC/RagA subfamily outer membrane receptor